MGTPDLVRIVADLGIINDLVDLCIDRELYDDISRIMCLSESAMRLLSTLPDGAAHFSNSTDPIIFPVTSVAIPDEWIDGNNILLADTVYDLFKESRTLPILTRWSYLFWAKRIRCEIKQNNNDEWLKLYDDLLASMEAQMPSAQDKRHCDELSWNRTSFHFLMELSAIAEGEASYGYAERARRLLSSYISYDDPYKRSNERWIWYNKGLAYQHIGRNQRAVLEFNFVIRTFWEYIDSEYEKCSMVPLIEFLLNVFPSNMQRASIQLKLQLGYHALQTLADSTMANWLDKLTRSDIPVFKNSAEHLRCCVNLLKLEALLQLERQADVDELFEDLFRVFPGHSWNPELLSLPPYNITSKRTGVQTQIVEQSVAWFLQRIRQKSFASINTLISSLKEVEKPPAKRDKIITDAEGVLSNARKVYKALRAVKDVYWHWAEGNRFDKRNLFCHLVAIFETFHIPVERTY